MSINTSSCLIPQGKLMKVLLMGSSARPSSPSSGHNASRQQQLNRRTAGRQSATDPQTAGAPLHASTPHVMKPTAHRRISLSNPLQPLYGNPNIL